MGWEKFCWAKFFTVGLGPNFVMIQLDLDITLLGYSQILSDYSWVQTKFRQATIGIKQHFAGLQLCLDSALSAVGHVTHRLFFPGPHFLV